MTRNELEDLIEKIDCAGGSDGSTVPPDGPCFDPYDPHMIDKIKLNDKTTYDEVEEQSFDSIVMECQDMLSIEDQVEKRYHEWLGGGSKRKIKWKCDSYTWVKYGSFFILSCLLLLFTPPIMSYPAQTFPRAINVVINMIGWISIIPLGAISIRKFNSSNISISVTQGELPQAPSESSKFQFLKESYSGTIKNLNTRLDLVQTRISEQVRTHQKDREQIQEYSDMFGDTTDIVDKIDLAISDLQCSSTKLSDKKAEINKSLHDYIGESGIIAQKEREIKRLKLAQELSDRMKTNFHTTMEITHNVDILTDTIIPALKQIMSLKIPELIEQVNYKCDTETAYLEISK